MSTDHNLWTERRAKLELNWVPFAYQPNALTARPNQLTREDIIETVMFMVYELWPWPWRQQHLFLCMALQHMMMHQHTKFGYQRFCSSEDTNQTYINWNFKCSLWPWPWTHQKLPSKHELKVWMFTVTLTSRPWAFDQFFQLRNIFCDR